MKIRNGWVGNSSSSSFVLYGYMIDIEEDSKLKDKYKANILSNDIEFDKYDFDNWVCDQIQPNSDDLQLEVYHGLDNYGSDTIFIGLYPDKMKDQETKIHFKQKVTNLINDNFKLYGNEMICVEDIQMYSDEGYD